MPRQTPGTSSGVMPARTELRSRPPHTTSRTITRTERRTVRDSTTSPQRARHSTGTRVHRGATVAAMVPTARLLRAVEPKALDRRTRTPETPPDTDLSVVP